MTQLWTEKYAPKTLDGVFGNAESIQQVRTWALDWQRGKKQKPLLLHGPPGTGKTAVARALANDMGWALLETNASNLRDGENVRKLMGIASATDTLFGEKRLVLFDEVDGAFDRGEIPALSQVVADSLHPIMLTANDVWNPKLSGLRASCTRVEFKKVGKADVKKALERIAEAEKAEADIELLAEASKGDLRSAIIDLQSGMPSERQREENVFEGVKRLFKSRTFDEAITAQDDSAIDFDLFERWIEENIPVEYDLPEDLAAAFDALSRADVFSGRIRRRQAWGLLKFRRVMALAGVGCAKRQQYRKFTPYRFPAYVKLLGQTQKSRGALKSASLKAGRKLNCSARKVRNDLPYYAAFSGHFEWDENERSAVGAEDLVADEKNGKRKKNPKDV